MKKVLLSMICILSLSMGKLDMNVPMTLEISLIKSVEEMNRELPVMIDAELRHDSVEVQGLRLILKFTLVNFTKSEMSPDRLKRIVELDIRDQICKDIETQNMLKQGMIMVYNYVDKNKNYISEFVYDAKVCDLLTNTTQIKQMLISMGIKEDTTAI